IPPPEATETDRTAVPDFSWDQIDGAETLFTPGYTGHFALTLPSAHGDWDAMGILADAAHRLAAVRQNTLLIVPDHKHLSRLQKHLTQRIGANAFGMLSAEQGNTARYRSFLRTLTGQHRIVIGTRSAIWAPLE